MVYSLAVLLVEDSEDDALLIINQIKRAGYDVHWKRVETAEELQQALNETGWNVVISDYILPHFSGMEALKIVHKQEPDMPFMIVSGKISDEIAVSAMKAGAHDYILKTNLLRLSAAIERELMEASVRKKTETALQESEEKFKNLVESLPVIIFSISSTGIITSLNYEFERATGWSREEWINKSFFKILHRDDISSVINAIKETGSIKNSLKLVKQELRLLAKSGNYIMVEATSRLQFRKGKVVEILGFARDITEQKKLEEQLMQSQKMEAIGRLASGIAHDFNNVLTAILGNAELLMLHLQAEAYSYQKIKTIHESALHATQLVEQLLTFSRKQVFKPIIFCMNDIISSMSNMFLQILGEDVDYRFCPAENLKFIQADPRQMEQVILNLVVNARDAMPNGGEISIFTMNANAHDINDNISYFPPLPEGEWILIAISDTGKGIPTEILGRIYEPFFTTKIKGTGLGLSIVYGIVKQLGGDIYVNSEIGKGTTFTIFLPAAREGIEKDASDNLFRATETCIGTETILVIEDNNDVLELIKNILEPLGYKLLLASHSIEAIAELQKHNCKPDLLLADIVLPGKAGPEIAQEIKNHFPDLKVLFMTGYTDERIAVYEYFNVDAPIILKPFDSQTLASKIREILDN